MPRYLRIRLSDPSRKLLIIEDDPGLLSQLRWCFEQYDVVTAEDRSSAIYELRRNEPLVVLQDLGLPPNPEGVDEGLATLQEILKLYDFSDAPAVQQQILGLSAVSSRQVWRRMRMRRDTRSCTTRTACP